MLHMAGVLTYVYCSMEWNILRVSHIFLYTDLVISIWIEIIQTVCKQTNGKKRKKEKKKKKRGQPKSWWIEI